jgi:hypothetical protein
MKAKSQILLSYPEETLFRAGWMMDEPNNAIVRKAVQGVAPKTRRAHRAEPV